MKKKDLINKLSISELVQKYPFAENFFTENNLPVETFYNSTFHEFIVTFAEDKIEDFALDVEKIEESLVDYIEQMKLFLGMEDENSIDVLTIVAGQDKSGNKEGFERLDIHKSEIISIVGPTGSGKSRLLADIEWTAQKDTPTKRQILINGEFPDKKWRYSSNNKLVAQLSQNMNFVMDLSVKEFLELHAQSRMIENIDETVEEIISAANKLAGEQFDLTTAITALSGGQSRALMIADTAILSSSPIVLIDEIENAGIDRKKALELRDQDKNVYLIIEEMTRGNIAEIFGDIFQLLDRNENGESEYEIDNENVYRIIYGKERNTDLDNFKIKLPSNFYLWGTLNTNDQNVFVMDNAFKRRFEFQLIKADGSKAEMNSKLEEEFKKFFENENKNGFEKDKFWRLNNNFVKKLNNYIVKELDLNEDKQIGNYFIKVSDDNQDFANIVANKLLYYLWYDVQKVTYGDKYIFNKDKITKFEDIFDKEDLDDIFDKNFCEKVIGKGNGNG